MIPLVKKREKKYKYETKEVKIQVNKTICLISDFGSCKKKKSNTHIFECLTRD